jgi:hypothetical protein
VAAGGAFGRRRARVSTDAAVCCMIEQEKGVRGCMRARGEERDQSRPSGSPGIAGFGRGCPQRSGVLTTNYFVLEALRAGKEKGGEGGGLGAFIGAPFLERGLGFSAGVIDSWDDIVPAWDTGWRWKRCLTGGTGLSAGEREKGVPLRVSTRVGRGLDPRLGQNVAPLPFILLCFA